MKSNCLLIFVSLIFSINCYSQRDIKGYILSKSNQPVAFANVYITEKADTTHIISGGVTDLTGEFKLTAKWDDQKILFASSLGYKLFSRALNELDSSHVIIRMENTDKLIGEVLITGSTVKREVDKTTYQPTINDRKNAYTSLSLIKIIPTLYTDEGNNKISTMSGESVKILINGRNADEIELSTLKPNQVVKIEHYTLPPARFSNSGAAEVINVLTKQAVEGGSVFTSLQHAFQTGYGNDVISLSYNKNRSQLGVYYYYSYRSNSDRVADGTLNYAVGNNVLQKEKTGSKSPFGYNMHIFNLNYVNQKDSDYTFGAKVSPNYSSTYRSPQYNFTRQQILTQSEGSGKQNSHYDEFTPNIDLYFEKSLPKDQDLIINVIGNIFQTQSDYFKIETSQQGDTLLKDSYENRGRKLSMITELCYSKKIKKIKLNAGFIYKLGELTNNNVNSFDRGNYIQHTNEKYGYGEIIMTFKKISFYGSIGLTRKYFKEEISASGYSFVTFAPKLSISFPLSENAILKTLYQKGAGVPSLSQLSSNKYLIDNYLVSTGNPDLQPYKSHYSRMSYDYKANKISAGTYLQFVYTASPILYNYLASGDYLVYSGHNEEWRKQLFLTSYIQWKILKDNMLTWNLYGSIFQTENKYIGRKKISLSGYLISTYLSFNYKKISINANFKSKLKDLDNYDVFTSPSESDLSALYRYNGFVFGAGLFLPLSKSYNYENESTKESPVYNRSIDRTYDYGKMFYLKLSYNFSFGHGYNWNKKLENQDSDTGTIKTM